MVFIQTNCFCFGPVASFIHVLQKALQVTSSGPNWSPLAEADIALAQLECVWVSVSICEHVWAFQWSGRSWSKLGMSCLQGWRCMKVYASDSHCEMMFGCLQWINEMWNLKNPSDGMFVHVVLNWGEQNGHLHGTLAAFKRSKPRHSWQTWPHPTLSRCASTRAHCRKL